jgi:hypothetical protein
MLCKANLLQNNDGGNILATPSTIYPSSLLLITRTMDRVRKPNISESDTPSSESYSNYHLHCHNNFGIRKIFARL